MSNLSNHHPLSPSHYPAWEECPCFEGSSKSSVEADKGTRAHKVLECLLNGTEYEEDDVSLVDAATWGYSEIMRLANGQRVFAESHMTIGGDDSLKGISGYIDAWWIDGIEVHVADFKTFDRGDTDYTTQMCGYALMLKDTVAGMEKATLHTVSAGARRVRTVEVTMDEASKRVKEAIAGHLSSDAEPNPCKYCKYCRLAKMCRGCDVTMRATSDATVFSTLSVPEQFVVVKAAKSLIKNFDESVKDKLRQAGGEMTANGITIKLVRGAAKSKFTDIPRIATVMNSNGVPPEKFIALCTVTKTALEGALRVKGPDGKYSRTKQEVDEILNPLAVKVEGSDEVKLVK